MRKLRSSWNSDRIAAAFIKSNKVTRQSRGRYLVASYKGNEVKVHGGRGKCYIRLEFDESVESAIVRDEILTVITRDLSRYVHNAVTGELISVERPTSPADAADYAFAA